MVVHHDARSMRIKLSDEEWAVLEADAERNRRSLVQELEFCILEFMRSSGMGQKEKPRKDR